MNQMLRNKTVEELLDIEEELKAEIDTEEKPYYYKLIEVYEHLYRAIGKDPHSEYQSSLHSIKIKLISYLVKYGTHLKTVDRKDDYASERTLKKAIGYEKKLPIAHYRLGFLSYKKSNFTQALTYFQKALNYQKQECDATYKLNHQQLHNAHLYLANCGLFIAKQTQEELEDLHLDVDLNKSLGYKVSPLYQMISNNEQYLANHEYLVITPGKEEYCSKEDIETLQDINESLVLDYSGREYLFIFNGREKRLSKSHAEMLRYFLINSKEDSPLTRHHFFDIFSVSGENGEVPRNTYIQNVRRIRNKLSEAGITEELLVNKSDRNETAYYYNQNYPYMIIQRSDDTFLLN
jgi:tetratricopeptide (TPR) repeat protein